MEFSDALSSLIQFDSKEKIDIITNTLVYRINKSFAAAISPLFSQLIKDNPMAKEIYLPIDENLDSFFEGKAIDRKLFLIMSIILDKKELIKKWKEENDLKKENIMEIVMKVIKYNGKIENMKEEIEFLGKHFEEMEKTMTIEKIPSKYLCEIMKNVKGIKSEEGLFKHIIERLKNENDTNIQKKLIECIEIRGLNNQEIKELLQYITYENLSENIFIPIKNQSSLFSQTQEELESAKEKNSELEKLLLKERTENQQKQTKINQIQEELNKKIQTISLLSSDITSKDSNIKFLEEALDEYVTKNENYQLTIKEQNSKIISLENSLNKSKSIIYSLEKIISSNSVTENEKTNVDEQFSGAINLSSSKKRSI